MHGNLLGNVMCVCRILIKGYLLTYLLIRLRARVVAAVVLKPTPKMSNISVFNKPIMLIRSVVRGSGRPGQGVS